MTNRENSETDAHLFYWILIVIYRVCASSTNRALTYDQKKNVKVSYDANLTTSSSAAIAYAS